MPSECIESCCPRLFARRPAGPVARPGAGRGPAVHRQPERNRYPGADQVRGGSHGHHHRGGPLREGQGQGGFQQAGLPRGAVPVVPVHSGGAWLHRRELQWRGQGHSEQGCPLRPGEGKRWQFQRTHHRRIRDRSHPPGKHLRRQADSCTAPPGAATGPYGGLCPQQRHYHFRSVQQHRPHTRHHRSHGQIGDAADRYRQAALRGSRGCCQYAGHPGQVRGQAKRW